MCIIIDTNTISRVFDRNNKEHEQFSEVYDWIIKKTGKVVFGGSKYAEEIPKKYLSLFVQLRNIRKAEKANDKEVDIKQAEISKKIKDKDFDDQHLVALLMVTGCKVICSAEIRADKFFKHKLFFSSKSKPKIYKNNKHVKLLADEFIADFCRPCTKLTQAQIKSIERAL